MVSFYKQIKVTKMKTTYPSRYQCIKKRSERKIIKITREDTLVCFLFVNPKNVPYIIKAIELARVQCALTTILHFCIIT